MKIGTHVRLTSEAAWQRTEDMERRQGVVVREGVKWVLVKWDGKGERPWEEAADNLEKLS